ncbi:diadenylate cyclase CdaA [Jeotgalibacillus campisalis]|uniref:Diadenylate cyclase n=1 Tax=Jeotgalibacillus campisalis TaxID=220754 RepID=A0A0C2SCS8_9BACL|nr:diadenylate cyclase CdaA [Jeotgalibacillus campisalis]KIL51774.1 membrane protein [Jeotgalibacillus campisalis]
MPFADQFTDLAVLDLVINAVDILLVWFVVYKLITVIRGTKAVQLLKGIFVIVIVRGLSELLGFNTLAWMMSQVMLWGVLGVIIIFQPELRRALEQLGRGKIFARGNLHEDEERERLVEAVTKSVSYMAKRRIGALITFEKETGMGDYIETGIQMDSHLTSELLINLFIPNTPLHDGAVIIQKNRIAAAACYLPLSESPFISKELGTRHRAALGVSEVTDSITVIVSEETGAISFTADGELQRNLDLDEFSSLLRLEWFGESETAAASTRWNWRGKKNNG